jgi:hypothetical protein
LSRFDSPPLSGSGSETTVQVRPHHRGSAAAILAATRHWPLTTPTDGDGDEAGDGNDPRAITPARRLPASWIDGRLPSARRAV